MPKKKTQETPKELTVQEEPVVQEEQVLQKEDLPTGTKNHQVLRNGTVRIDY